jgi:hypothetical protein
MPTEEVKAAAPYLPFKTFLSSLEPFSQVVPPKIDRTIWRQSGLTQSQIMGAYRFFNLIDDNDRPTTALHRLIDNKEKRPQELKTLLNAYYGDVLAHDLKKMTPKMLDELIEQYGISGATKKKAITFFLQAAKYSGMELSSFLSVRNTSGTRRRRSAKKEGDGADPIEQYEPEAPTTGTGKRITLRSGGELSLRVNVDLFGLSNEDRTFVFKLIDELRAYEGSAQDKSNGASK